MFGNEMGAGSSGDSGTCVDTGDDDGVSPVTGDDCRGASPTLRSTWLLILSNRSVALSCGGSGVFCCICLASFVGQFDELSVTFSHG